MLNLCILGDTGGILDIIDNSKWNCTVTSIVGPVMLVAQEDNLLSSSVQNVGDNISGEVSDAAKYNPMKVGACIAEVPISVPSDKTNKTTALQSLDDHQMALQLLLSTGDRKQSDGGDGQDSGDGATSALQSVLCTDLADAGSSCFDSGIVELGAITGSSRDSSNYVKVEVDDSEASFGTIALDDVETLMSSTMLTISGNESVVFNGVELASEPTADGANPTDNHYRNVHFLAPQIVRNVPAFQCSLCSCLYFKTESALQHVRRQHGREKDAAQILTQPMSEAYVCTVCQQPTMNSYRWQAHMRRAHSIVIDRRRRPGADCQLREQKRRASLRNKSFPKIACIICSRQMHLPESYHLHIKKQHQKDEEYRGAIRHLHEIRASRQSVAVTVECPLCTAQGPGQRIIAHIESVHADENDFDVILKQTKAQLGGQYRIHRRFTAMTRCEFCRKTMMRSNVRSHQEFHCPAVCPVAQVAELSNGENKVEVAVKSADGRIYVRPRRMAQCGVCGKLLNLRAMYHHQRRVHRVVTGKVGPATFECSFCQKTFWDKHHLRQHLSMHTSKYDTCSSLVTKRN